MAHQASRVLRLLTLPFNRLDGSVKMNRVLLSADVRPCSIFVTAMFYSVDKHFVSY